MAVSVSAFFTRIAWDLHETDNTFATGAWTQTEMLGYLNYAEKTFLEKTGALKQYTSIIAADGSAIQFDRPTNSIDIDRISADGKQLHRQSLHNLMLEDRAWRSRTGGKPSYWHEDSLPINKFEINKILASGTTLRIVSDYLPIEYTAISGNINLKDCWEPYLRWKVLELALGKDGDNQDIPRSEYAGQRFMFGVTLAKRLLKGKDEVRLRR